MSKIQQVRPLTIAFIILVLLAARPLPAQAAGEGPFSVYLPGVMASGGRVMAAAQPACELTAQEQALADLMIQDPAQMRASLTCDPILAEVAREKAEDMASRGYFGHVNPDGLGANTLVEAAGYDLPPTYDSLPESNNIESLAADYSGAAFAWAALVASPTHRMHVLAEAPFFQEQTDYGIGYAYNPASPYTHYWVILTASH